MVATYVKLACPGIGRAFSKFDGVQVSGILDAPELNGAAVIWEKGEDHVVITGLLDRVITQEADQGSIVITRRLPEMDFVIESENRLWGCRYGLSADGQVVTCGPMAEAGPPVYDWSNPAGFVVTVSGDGFVPGAQAAAPAAAVALSEYGLPLSGAGDTSMDAYKTYLKAYMDCVPEMQGKEEELFGLIDQETFDLPPVVMAFEGWFQEDAMSYDAFVAAGGSYSLESFVLTSPATGSPV